MSWTTHENMRTMVRYLNGTRLGGHPKSVNTTTYAFNMREHREIKREQAEERNAQTPYERTRQFRRDGAVLNALEVELHSKAKNGKVTKRMQETLEAREVELKQAWLDSRAALCGGYS